MQMSPIPFIIAMTVNAFEDTVIGIPEVMPVPSFPVCCALFRSYEQPGISSHIGWKRQTSAAHRICTISVPKAFLLVFHVMIFFLRITLFCHVLPCVFPHPLRKKAIMNAPAVFSRETKAAKPMREMDKRPKKVLVNTRQESPVC